mgnify:CR=1 FL=1
MIAKWLAAASCALLVGGQATPDVPDTLTPEKAVAGRRALDGRRVRVTGVLSLTWEDAALRSVNCRDPQQLPRGFTMCSLAIEIDPGAERDDSLRKLETWMVEARQRLGQRDKQRPSPGDSVTLEATGTLVAAVVHRPSPQLPELEVPFPPGFGAKLRIDQVRQIEQPLRNDRPRRAK